MWQIIRATYAFDSENHNSIASNHPRCLGFGKLYLIFTQFEGRSTYVASCF